MARGETRLRGGWLRLPWGRMRVWRGGEGPALLAVHGLGGSGRYWDGLASRVGHRFTVIAPDLAGFGRSDEPRVEYDRGFHLDNLDAVVRRTAGDVPVVLVGHSLGAIFAALWSAEHLEQVSALALAAAPFPSGDGPPEWARRGPRPGLRVAVGAAKATWPLLGVPIGVARGYPPALVMDFGRQRLHSRWRTLASTVWDPELPAALEAVRAIPGSLPTLLVNATDDRTVGLAEQERWAALLPHAERRMLGEGGHQFLLRSRFEALAEWLLALPEA
jgi:pimeloyl-ACP methyl ester carboxylesterase